jgi:hypothetical protein
MVTGIGTVIAALLAIVAASIFWRQLGTMQAQLDSQEADFRIDQRPILSITRNVAPSDHLDGLQYNPDTKQLLWNYTIGKFGKGTAITTNTCGYMSILGDKFIANQNGSPIRGAQIVPTQTYWGTVWHNTAVEPNVWSILKILMEVLLLGLSLFTTMLMGLNTSSPTVSLETQMVRSTGMIARVLKSPTCPSIQTNVNRRKLATTIAL